MAKISKKPTFSLPGVEPGGPGGLLNRDGRLSEHEHLTHSPCVDMYSTPKEVVVEAEMPGMKKEDIEVALSNNMLVIRAQKHECFDSEKIKYVCLERSFGRFQRVIDIPFPVDSSRIKAAYKNGILKITLPRVDDKRCRMKKVEIES